jgi:exopolysaccharide production protein ExoZ
VTAPSTERQATTAPSILYNLHLLRAIAALGVVYFHITSEAGLNLSPNIGAHGVDVFFVISGFIISFIAAESPRHFLTRRLIRIVPFYWAATLFVFAVALIFPSVLRSTQADVTQLIYSLLFIPRETSYAGIVPTLVLGWSLNYEMYFYVMFACALALSRRWAPLLCLTGIAIIASVVSALHATSPSALFYSRPIVFEFGLGIGVYYWFRAAVARPRAQSPRTRSWPVWLLAMTATIALGVEEFHHGFGAPRFLAAGIPAFLLVSSSLALERTYGFAARNKIVYLLGESSYILYLVHPYIIYGCLRLVLRGHIALHGPAIAALVIALMTLAATVAIAIHLIFEKPLLGYLRRRILPAKMPRAEQAVPRSSRAYSSAVSLSGR